ncbi:MAG: methyltransferase domain-containing protein [Candidatus Sulfotelmatobacter sp.]
MDARDSRLSERDQAEIERSAEEARKIVLRGVDRAQIDRYRNPPRDTPFALEYAFHLLGDVRGKTVLDFGCGTGENTVPLAERGARVIGMDISPDLIALARKRLNDANLEARLEVGSAYDTGLPDESVDVIFCIALIHHLDIARVVDEMARILVNGGVVILREPIRFSRTYAFLRGLLPAHEDISDFEHPLTREELRVVTERFKVLEQRYFRLPFMPLVHRFLAPAGPAASRLDRWILKNFSGAERFATIVTLKLQKQGESS